MRRIHVCYLVIDHVYFLFTLFSRIVHLHCSFTSLIFIVHVQRASCKYNSTFIGTTAIGCMEVLEGSETDLQAALVVEGPLSAAIDASHPTFQFYR